MVRLPAMADLLDVSAVIRDDPALSRLQDELVARLDGDPGHDLGHCRRVARWTLRLAEAPIEPRRAIAAALLHDVVNLPKDSPDRASASERSAEVARALLPGLGFAPEAVADVAEAIRDHSFSRGATPRTPLGRALQDADRLEALGALGLFRTVACGVRMGAAFFHPDDPFADGRELDDRRFTVDHFFCKLLGLPGTMLTEGGRREAERRVDIMRSFLRALARELDVPLTHS